MRRFQLHDLKNGEDVFSYRETLLALVRNPASANAGFTLEEIRRGVRLLDAIEPVDVEGVVTLEDADYEYLLKRVQTTNAWARVDRRVLDLLSDIENAERIDN